MDQDLKNRKPDFNPEMIRNRFYLLAEKRAGLFLSPATYHKKKRFAFSFPAIAVLPF
jgi:hypothetical protein